MIEIKIISFNCQGLDYYKKRKAICFNTIDKKKCKILCLVETNFTKRI